MISRLRMSNFRKHRETELHFPDEAQLVLFAGENGAGKSTLVEAIIYSLYGESRFGKRNLDKLVRRGAELEGLETEIDFNREGVEYAVRRRRVNKLATAVLYANGEAIVEGSNQVSAEVSRILGMDSTAFRLAVLAQQKDLEGLTSLRPAERAAQLSRLLRLDAISRARDEARTLFRNERDIVRSLNGLDDLDELTVEVATTEQLLDVARQAESEAVAALGAVDARITESAAVDALWATAQRESARAEGAVTSARSEVNRLVFDLDRIIIPEVVAAPNETLEELTAAATDVERRIAQGEAADQVRSQRTMVEGELERIATRLDELARTEASFVSEDDLVTALAAAERFRNDVQALRERLVEDLVDLREQVSRADTEAGILRRQAEATDTLGAECDRCGQEISEDHRHQQLGRLQEEAAAKEAEVAEITTRGRDLRARIAELDLEVESSVSAVTRLRDDQLALQRSLQESAELRRRQAMYTGQLERLQVPDVDLDELYARKGEVAILLAQAQQAARSLRDREAALTRKLDLDMAITSAKERLAVAEAEFAAAALDADLEAAYAARQELLAQRSDEQAMAHHWSTEAAVTAERLTAVRAAHRRAQAALERRRGHEARAQAASNAARVLAAVEEKLNSQIRPALEGSVSDVLSNLSEGRFSSVKVDQDYNITVCDDGQFSDLSELSGGEKDLVALAIRLALASVVAERHGGGVGFLILDECLGSQDAGRRGSILTVLRGLRSTYGQIMLISHVVGIEDEADVVVEVELVEDEDELVAEARIS